MKKALNVSFLYFISSLSLPLFLFSQDKPKLFCHDKIFQAEIDQNNNCKANVDLQAIATTTNNDCGNDSISWHVFIDLWGNGTTDLVYKSSLPKNDPFYIKPTTSGEQVNVPGNAPSAFKILLELENVSHKVHWKATNYCGETVDCFSNFYVKDLNAPVVVLKKPKSEIYFTDTQGGNTAKSFDSLSFDNCTNSSSLMFTFNGAKPVWNKLNVEHIFKGDGIEATAAEYALGFAQRWVPSERSSVKILTCEGMSYYEESTITITVWDNWQNSSSENFTAKFYDPIIADACDWIYNPRYKFNFNTKYSTSIKGIHLIYDNQMNGKFVIDEKSFEFRLLSYNTNVCFNISKSEEALNGIDVGDIKLLNAYLSGKIDFDIITKFAADINQDGNVDHADLEMLKRLYYGVEDGSKLLKWKFIPTSTPTQKINFDDFNVYGHKRIEFPFCINWKEKYKSGEYDIELNYFVLKPGDLNFNYKN